MYSETVPHFEVKDNLVTDFVLYGLVLFHIGTVHTEYICYTMFNISSKSPCYVRVYFFQEQCTF